MSEPTGEVPPDESLSIATLEDGEQPELFKILITQDETRAAFLDACVALAKMPGDPQATENITEHTIAMATHFRTTLVDIFKGSPGDLDDHLASIATLLDEEARIRLAAFNHAIGEDIFKFSKEETEENGTLTQTLAAMFRDADSEEDFLDAVFAQYVESVEEGVNVFAGAVEDKNEAEQQGNQVEQTDTIEVAESRRAKLARLAGQSALDIAKIGVGVTVGILVARRLSKD